MNTRHQQKTDMPLIMTKMFHDDKCDFPPAEMSLGRRIDRLQKSINLLTPNRPFVNGDFVRINVIVKDEEMKSWSMVSANTND